MLVDFYRSGKLHSDSGRFVLCHERQPHQAFPRSQNDNIDDRSSSRLKRDWDSQDLIFKQHQR